LLLESLKNEVGLVGGLFGWMLDTGGRSALRYVMVVNVGEFGNVAKRVRGVKQRAMCQ